MSRPTNAAPEALPTFRNAEELDSYARARGLNRDSLRAGRTSVEGRRGVVNQLQQAGLNGQSERVGEHLIRVQTELDRKESWLRRIPLIGKPLDWTWQKMKKHPFMTAFLGLGVGAAILGWYYGYLGRNLLNYLPNYSGAVNRVGRQAAIPTTPDAGLNGVGVGGVNVTPRVDVVPTNPAYPIPQRGVFATPNVPPVNVVPPPRVVPVQPNPSGSRLGLEDL
jgi:hypothetical protein